MGLNLRIVDAPTFVSFSFKVVFATTYDYEDFNFWNISSAVVRYGNHLYSVLLLS